MATLALALALLLGLAPGCGSASESPFASPIGTIPASVIAMNSVQHAIGGRAVAASFRRAMDASTVAGATATAVGPDGTSVSHGVAR
jgi:hypothetical protein